MSDFSKKTVSIFIDQTAAEVSLTKLQAKADELTKSITKGQAAGKNMENEIRKLGDTNNGIDKLKDQIAKGLTPTLQQQENLVRQIRNELRLLSQDAPEYATKLASFQKVNTQLQEMKNNLNGVKEAQSNWLSQFKGIAAGVLFANGVQGVISSVVNGIKGAIATVVELNSKFENSVANLSAITGATGQDLEYLKNQAIELSKTGARSATDYVEAFKLIASAKPELLGAKEDLVKVTEAANLLSNAAGIELPDAAKRLTDALNQFGAPAADAGKYVDALAAASKYGAAEVPEVTDALLQFGAQAKSSNISIYESSGAIELLAEKGLKGADAGTKLRNVFLALNAVKALPPEAVAQLDAAGVNTNKLSDTSLSLQDRLTELSKIQNSATAIVKVFGKENFNAAQIVLQNIPRYAQLTSQIQEQGVAEQQASVNTNTLSNAWEKFKNVLASRFLDGDNTFLKRLVKDATDAIAPTKSASDQFYELSKNIVHLQTDIEPLTTRYEELKKKANELGGVTKLTTKEQDEMKSVINQIIAVVPGAASEFDKYGNAIAISTGRVYEFINAETARLKVINAKAIEDYGDKLQDVNDKLKNQKIIMDQIAAGKYEVSESTNTGSGSYITESRKATQDEIAAEEKKYNNLLEEQLGIQKELEQLNGNSLSQQLNRANVIKQLEAELAKLKEGTKGYANLLAEINTLKGITTTTTDKSTKDDGSYVDEAAEKLAKKQAEAQKQFNEFIKGLDNSIQDNAIPEHAKKIIDALQKMADETARLNEIAKLDKNGKPTNISAEQYAEGGKKILQEYKTFLQKFVEDEAKNFKAPVNASTIADGAITPSADKPKINLPLNINTDVTQEEEKALKEKLDNLQKKLEELAKFKEEQKADLKERLQNLANEAVNIYGEFQHAQDAMEQKQLNKELKLNDTKKAALQKQLNQKLISQQQFNIKSAQLDAEANAKQEELAKKQFERNKKQQILQAFISGALAINNVNATVPKVIPFTLAPNPEYPIALGISIATTAAQVAAIAAQKFAGGGRVNHLGNGRITTPSNILVQPNGDDVLATVKRGEVIMNEEQQRRAGGPDFFRRIGVPGFAMGGVVKPAYQTRSYQAIDYAGATRSFQTIRHYATGGLVVANSNNPAPATDPALLALLQSNQEALETLHYTVDVLQTRLSKPIEANANISLKKIDNAYAQKDRILNEATFK